MILVRYAGTHHTILSSLVFSTQEDKGSALMCQSSAGLWELQGLLSTPGVCRAQARRPAIFSEVQGVKEWIWATLGKEQ